MFDANLARHASPRSVDTDARGGKSATRPLLGGWHNEAQHGIAQHNMVRSGQAGPCVTRALPPCVRVHSSAEAPRCSVAALVRGCFACMVDGWTAYTEARNSTAGSARVNTQDAAGRAFGAGRDGSHQIRRRCCRYQAQQRAYLPWP